VGAVHDLDAGILESVPSVSDRGEDPLELVAVAVVGDEEEHVGEVVDEARPSGRGVLRVALPDTPGEQVEPALDHGEAGVEDRSVTRDGPGFDQRLGADPSYEHDVNHDLGDNRGEIVVFPSVDGGGRLANEAG